MTSWDFPDVSMAIPLDHGRALGAVIPDPSLPPMPRPDTDISGEHSGWRANVLDQATAGKEARVKLERYPPLDGAPCPVVICLQEGLWMTNLHGCSVLLRGSPCW